MGTLAVAIVGGPLTMSLPGAGDHRRLRRHRRVLAACVVASLVVRETFGYSFSTWRLHLRGETIRSANDVGWMRQLTVGRMMRARPGDHRRRRQPGRVPPPLSAGLDPAWWCWSTRRAATSASALIAEAFAAEEPEEAQTRAVADLARWRDSALLPEMNVKQAMAVFDRTESETLAVVDGLESRKVLGLLTEAYATAPLRRGAGQGAGAACGRRLRRRLNRDTG